MIPALKARLADDGPMIGFHLMFPAAGILECLEPGWDWVWIDGQHGQHDYRSILECVRTADACGLAPIVRVPDREPGFLGRVLDMRPAGVMIPAVESATEARECVQATRLPPLGHRSVGGRRVGDLCGRNAFRPANEATLAVVQIETREGLENVDAIAETEGVDALFLGPDDLRVSMDIPIDLPLMESKELMSAMRTVAEAAGRSGKIAGCPVATPEGLEVAVSAGYRLIAGGTDIVFVRDTAKARIAALRAALGE